MASSLVAPYRRVFSLPGAARFCSAGFVARLSNPMILLTLVILVQQRTGSYGYASALAGCYGLSRSLAAPQLSRLVDRSGQFRIVFGCLLFHLAMLTALIATVHSQLPRAVAFLPAVLAGLSVPPVSSLMRSRWRYVTSNDPAARHTAFSMESVLDETVYAVGPILVSVIIALLNPIASYVVASGLVGLGGLLLVTGRSTEPPVVSQNTVTTKTKSVLRTPGMVALVTLVLGFGSVYGAMVVAVIARCNEAHQPGLSGWLIGGSSVTSMIAGLVLWFASASRLDLSTAAG